MMVCAFAHVSFAWRCLVLEKWPINFCCSQGMGLWQMVKRGDSTDGQSWQMDGKGGNGRGGRWIVECGAGIWQMIEQMVWEE
jgi:hypothetical protein